MKNRTFGRLGWQVGEVGYGMWGIAGGEGGWTGADDVQGMNCLNLALDKGCNFFDTAWIYGRGHSEKMLGTLKAERTDKDIFIATKIAPKNRNWPSKRTDRFDDLFPEDYLWQSLETSRNNLGVDCIDLMQFHVWEDSWANEDAWLRIIEDWKSQNLVKGIGLSLNRWEPWNGVKAVETGLVDSIQVIYNIFDQSPKDALFPACHQHNVGVIARVPFDEGTLTGNLTKDTKWEEGDWRNSYFVPENLIASVEHAEALRPLVPADNTMAELALRFILQNKDITTVIPGMRQAKHVEANIGVSDQPPLSADLMAALEKHRWDREPTEWSQ